MIKFPGQTEIDSEILNNFLNDFEKELQHDDINAIIEMLFLQIDDKPHLINRYAYTLNRLIDQDKIIQRIFSQVVSDYVIRHQLLDADLDNKDVFAHGEYPSYHVWHDLAARAYVLALLCDTIQADTEHIIQVSMSAISGDPDGFLTGIDTVCRALLLEA